MRLKKIVLENIRSYKKQEIIFPNGSVLLSGDIGSGKTTVLLALEFALFGLQSPITGTNLLRSGTQSGSVEVELEIDGKLIRIRRTLKRSKKSVVQDRGYIIINDIKEELGPEELKERILNLLGYPVSLIKAKTNLLYRFTVYTPQEEMRQILQEDADERIDVIRKIFGIDRYKKIVENAETIAAKLREEARFKESQIVDLPMLLKQEEEKKKELMEESSKLEKILPTYQQLVAELKKAQEEAEKIVMQRNKLNELKLEHATTISELKAKENELKEVEEQIAENETQIKNLKVKLSAQGKEMAEPEGSIKRKLQEQLQEQRELNEKLKSVEVKIMTLESRKRELTEARNRIANLEKCPTCQQKITPDHKCALFQEYEKQLEEIEFDILQSKENSKKIWERLKEIEKKIENLREQEKIQERNKVLLETLNEKKGYGEKLKKKSQNLKEEIAAKKEKKEKIEKELLELKDIDALDLAIKEKIENLKKSERELEIEKVKCEKNIENINKMLEALKQEIEKKENIAREAEKLRRLNDWLLDHFVKLIMIIEKTVMAKLNKEFNLLFQKWFNILVENLNARIDENFTPIIEQQGYELNFDSLSGGERTAAALAYRLALNQIINHFMGKLKTKGLLILDEPTDGFSSEQISKMRDILNELTYEQLIIVSHESEIEDFVDNVIYLEKKDGVTILQAKNI